MMTDIIALLIAMAFGYYLGFFIRYVIDENREKIMISERSDFDDSVKYNNLEEDPEKYSSGKGRNYHNVRT
tara:strand:- start:33 stop:245 length:213 start_codon:yes stop_codon:yes gene_type:complete